MTEPDIKGWEEEFDERFIDDKEFRKTSGYPYEVKAYITTLLERQRAEFVVDLQALRISGLIVDSNHGNVKDLERCRIISEKRIEQVLEKYQPQARKEEK